MRLLIDSEFILYRGISGLNLFLITDIEYFLKSTIKKHKN